MKGLMADLVISTRRRFTIWDLQQAIEELIRDLATHRAWRTEGSSSSTVPCSLTRSPLSGGGGRPSAKPHGTLADQWTADSGAARP